MDGETETEAAGSPCHITLFICHPFTFTFSDSFLTEHSQEQMVETNPFSTLAGEP